jgi:uncharacterized membrane protein YsdA (DUF1294 family)
MPNSLAYYLAAVNVLALIAYVLDHYHSDTPHRELIDKALLALAVIGGSVGAAIAVFVGRMKLDKPLFRLGIPVIFFAELVILLLAF